MQLLDQALDHRCRNWGGGHTEEGMAWIPFRFSDLDCNDSYLA